MGEAVKRGFTLMELLVVLTLLPVMAAAIGSFYLEGRIATARVEARVSLNRSLSLAMEHMGRDLRSAASVETSTVGIKMKVLDERVIYEVLPSTGLVRTACGRDCASRPLVPRVRGLRVEADEAGYRIFVKAVRPLALGRALTVRREGYVARRK